MQSTCTASSIKICKSWITNVLLFVCRALPNEWLGSRSNLIHNFIQQRSKIFQSYIFDKTKLPAFINKRTLSSYRSRCRCCNLKTMKFFSGWLYEEEESEGMFYPLVPVMQPLPVRQWNLFAANSKSWEWHENWQNKYAGARPKKDGVILRGQLVTFFHSLYLTTKNALPWSKINYGLELVIPWKQTILYHGTGHTLAATIP